MKVPNPIFSFQNAHPHSHVWHSFINQIQVSIIHVLMTSAPDAFPYLCLRFLSMDAAVIHPAAKKTWKSRLQPMDLVILAKCGCWAPYSFLWFDFHIVPVFFRTRWNFLSKLPSTSGLRCCRRFSAERYQHHLLGYSWLQLLQDRCCRVLRQ